MKNYTFEINLKHIFSKMKGNQNISGNKKRNTHIMFLFILQALEFLLKY